MGVLESIPAGDGESREFSPQPPRAFSGARVVHRVGLRWRNLTPLRRLEQPRAMRTRVSFFDRSLVLLQETLPEADDWRRIEQLANQLREVSIAGQARQLNLKQKQFAFSLTQVS